ncbi:ABC transporter permease [Bacillus sp. 03113]|uniref:ABC transporter permease n=1 Tax=Bacillus sp. 03113 TaxID=2578211 RepID=UPI001142318E|nr:ABC transporter permease [Bacillus sp. 03113]
MGLRRKNLNNPIKSSLLFILFGFVFFLIILFLLLLIVGLLSYSDLKTVANVLLHPEFHFSLLFTLWTSLLATFFATIAALPCGYILSRYKLPGRAFFDTLLDIPIALPPLVSGIALLIFFGPFMGKHLEQAGINIVFSPLGVIVAQWFIATPYAIKIFQQGFASIDQRMENIARTLGFSPTMVFFKVTLPLTKNAILSGIMMAWTRALGEFGATAMLAGITRMKTETLSVAVFLNMSIGDIKFAISTAIVMIFITLILLISIKFVLRNEART